MSPKWLEGEVSRIAIRESHITQTDGQLVIVPNSILFKNPVTIRTDSGLRRITVICGAAYDVDLDTAVTVVASTVTSIGVALVLALLLASRDLFYVKLVQALPQRNDASGSKGRAAYQAAHVCRWTHPRRHCIWAGSAPRAPNQASLSRADTSQRQNLAWRASGHH
jgi:hypothetical protein